MYDPFSTLILLNTATLQLDDVQSWIDSARTTFPADQQWQLKLDRKQTEVDQKRELIETFKLDIARRN